MNNHSKTNKREFLPFNERDFSEFALLLEPFSIQSMLYPCEYYLSPHSSHPLHPDYKREPELEATTFGGDALRKLTRRTAEKVPFYKDIETEKKAQAERISERWKCIKATKFYKYLADLQGYKNAHKTFCAKRAQTKANGYKQPESEFHFVYQTGFCIAAYRISKGTAFAKSNPAAKDVISALVHLKKITRAFQLGVGLDDAIKQGNLKSQINELIAKLEDHKKHGRKKWTGQESKYRDFVQEYASQLRRKFGEASPKIVCEIATTVGYNSDIKTIQNYLKPSS